MNETIRAIAELIRSLAWPGVAIFASMYYRKEIADLARRLRKGGAVEFDPIPQSTAGPGNPLTVTASVGTMAISTVASNTLENYPRTPATAALEERLLEMPQFKAMDAPAEREKVLVRLLARALLVNQFEQADASIWASQLDLLTYLNAKRQGESLTQVQIQFYDKARSQYPVWYDNYSLDSWLAFLQRNRLVNVHAGLVAITEEGIEYLGWRVQQARPPKLLG